MALLKRGGRRLVDSFTFAASARQTMDIEVPQRFIKAFYVWVRGTLTISAVTVPGTVHTDGAAQLITTLELLVNGKTVKFGSGPSFLRMAQKYQQTAGVNNGINTANASAQPFEALIPLLFEMPSSVSPIDSLLDGRLVSSITLNLTWGAAGAQIVNNTSTTALTVTTAEVYVDDTEPFDTQGRGFWTFQEVETTEAGIVTSTASRLQVPFSPGEILRAIQLRAIDGVDLSDAIINSYDLRINGGEERPYTGNEDDFAQAISLYDFGVDFLPDGYYHLELAEGGRPATTGLGAKLEGQAVNSVDIIADTTVGAGATSVVIHTAKMIPPEISGIGV